MKFHADAYRRDDPDRRFLQSRVWREKLRPAQLAREPLCRFCRALGYIEEARQVDHIERPFGDTRLQRDPANFQSMCAYHHNLKSNWERRADGKPLVVGRTRDGWTEVVAVGGTIKLADLRHDQPAGNRTCAKPSQF